MSNIILTQPQGILGTPGTSIADVDVPGIGSAPNNVVVVDTSEYVGVKWIYTLFDNTANKILMAEILAMRRGGSPEIASYNHYGIIGDLIRHTISVEIINSNLALEITNLHTNPLKINAVQIQVAFS